MQRREFAAIVLEDVETGQSRVVVCNEYQQLKTARPVCTALGLPACDCITGQCLPKASAF